MPGHCNMLKTLSIIGYLGMIGGLFGLVVTQALLSNSPFVIAVQVMAVLLFGWARVVFGRRSYHVMANPTQGGLVTSGPYRYIRHPIYTAFCHVTKRACIACSLARRSRLRANTNIS